MAANNLTTFCNADIITNSIDGILGLCLEKVPASSHELQKVVRYTKRFSYLRTGGRTAIVGNTMLKYSMARMASTFAEMGKLPWEMQPFKNLEEATA